MGRVIRDFFTQPTLVVAESLLGKILVHKPSEGFCYKGMIVETEAYLGKGDDACHASRKMTPRNSVMFRNPGTLYVYFSYGSHNLLNIVTEPEGTAGAVLIRAMEPVEGIEMMKKNRKTDNVINLMNGPGKLTQAMEISLRQNGSSLHDTTLYLEEGTTIAGSCIETTPRVGISKSTDLLWRKYISGNPYVSKASPLPPTKKKRIVLES